MRLAAMVRNAIWPRGPSQYGLCERGHGIAAGLVLDGKLYPWSARHGG